MRRLLAQPSLSKRPSALTESLNLQDYPATFPVARALRRRIHFRLGPTNSGKTQDALIALQNADSGVYLAPLRLLAMEIRDRLMEAGTPCNLITGEERVLVPGARHTASTGNRISIASCTSGRLVASRSGSCRLPGWLSGPE